MERQLILLAGKPGSGKSRLGSNVVEALEPHISAEHLSVGNLVRAIGRKSIESTFVEAIASQQDAKPLPDNIMSSLIEEHLAHRSAANLLLLDGYPRYESQVDDTYVLAGSTGFPLRGMLLTNVIDDIAIKRMLNRHKKHPERKMDAKTAKHRLVHHHEEFTPVLQKLMELHLPVETIDTSGQKKTATNNAVRAVLQMLKFDARN